jgi:hypothetical protein
MTEAQDSTIEPKVEENEQETAFQRLVADEEQAQEMIDDLENLERLVPEGEDPDDVQGWQIALSFDATDVPYLLEELRGVTDDGQ